MSDMEAEVLRRYGAGAKEREEELCCPVEYESKYLAVLPREILERDYGCGDPSRHVGEGETVLDLGSGAGKICYILAQKVGARGRVVGVDFNDEMLALARKHREGIAAKLGYDNVRFLKGRIQDLAFDLENPDGGPLVADASIDAVVSNCVLNLVATAEKERLFAEIYRVLKPDGRAVISDIVCDQDPTPEILADPELWSGCIAGAFREDRFPAMFSEAGFRDVEVIARQEEPWRVIDGIEFRSLTVRAWKGRRLSAKGVDSSSTCGCKPGPCC